MSGQPVQMRPTIGFDFETLTVSNTAKTLTASKYRPSAGDYATAAWLTNEGYAIRYRYDGTAPTSTVGHLLPNGGTLILNGQNQMALFQAIRITSDSAISVTYERE